MTGSWQHPKRIFLRLLMLPRSVRCRWRNERQTRRADAWLNLHCIAWAGHVVWCAPRCVVQWSMLHLMRPLLLHILRDCMRARTLAMRLTCQVLMETEVQRVAGRRGRIISTPIAERYRPRIKSLNLSEAFQQRVKARLAKGVHHSWRGISPLTCLEVAARSAARGITLGPAGGRPGLRWTRVLA